MDTFEQFLENKKDDTPVQTKAIMDMVHALQSVFKKYSLTNRKKAWAKLMSKEGHKEFDKLITSPTRNTSVFRTL